MDNEVLYHHGILGMKWGIRRSRKQLGNSDGGNQKTKRPQSKLEIIKAKRANKKVEKESVKEEKTAEKEIEKRRNKSISEMTDTELRDKINRMQMERQLLDLNKQVSLLQPQKVSKGKEIAKTVMDKVVIPTATEMGKKYLNKVLEEKLGLKPPESETSKLKKEVELLTLKRQKAVNEDFFSNRNAKANSDDNKTSDKQSGQSWNSNTKSSESKQDTSSNYKKTEPKQDTSSNYKKTEPKQDTSSNYKKTEPKQEKTVYEGTVEGKGTSTYTPKKGPIVDGLWRSVDDIPAKRIEQGKQYLAYLLEDKSGR